MNQLNEKQWTDHVKGLIKAELAKRNLSYIQLADLLAERGINETPQNLSNKIGRGKFGAVFMLQVLEAIGCKCLPIEPTQ